MIRTDIKKNVFEVVDWYQYEEIDPILLLVGRQYIGFVLGRLKRNDSTFYEKQKQVVSILLKNDVDVMSNLQWKDGIVIKNYFIPLYEENLQKLKEVVSDNAVLSELNNVIATF